MFIVSQSGLDKGKELLAFHKHCVYAWLLWYWVDLCTCYGFLSAFSKWINPPQCTKLLWQQNCRASKTSDCNCISVELYTCIYKSHTLNTKMYTVLRFKFLVFSTAEQGSSQNIYQDSPHSYKLFRYLNRCVHVAMIMCFYFCCVQLMRVYMKQQPMKLLNLKVV